LKPIGNEKHFSVAFTHDNLHDACRLLWVAGLSGGEGRVCVAGVGYGRTCGMNGNSDCDKGSSDQVSHG
ncbi:hypothetical protein, partial [Enterobacter cloacae]|uniref:hypothetical protein n=1 Tax=Enterobacter cloacae TaxID=550 RepID=UPI0019533FED